MNQYFLLLSVKKNLLTKSQFGHLGQCVDGLDALRTAIMVEIEETEDENDGWPKITKNQTNHVVATGINHDVTAMQYHLLHNNGYQK